MKIIIILRIDGFNKFKRTVQFELNSRSGFEHFGSATGIIILIRMDADPQQ